MAYQSLYRTWRPRQFKEMIGQEAIRRALSNQSATGRIAHAYLFCGSRGTGKTSAARIMAMAINCQNPKDGDPCLQCPSCQALSSETTLDVFEMDAASNSRVEEIREMLSKTDYPPQFVKYKVYIIDEVHMLSNAAFNALLKTLEEPPEYMVFILATTEPQKLPATILSRCQRFDFGRIPEREIIARLKLALSSSTTADEGALQLIAAAAEGSMRDAWSLMDMCLGSQNHLSEEIVREALGTVSRDFLFSFMDALGRGDARQVLEMTDQLMQAGRDVQVFLREMGTHLRQVLSVKWTGKPLGDHSSEQIARYVQQARENDAASLLAFLDLCMQAEQDTRWASSPRAVLELFALKCCQAAAVPSAAVHPKSSVSKPDKPAANPDLPEKSSYSAGSQPKPPASSDPEEEFLDSLPPVPWLPPDFLQSAQSLTSQQEENRQTEQKAEAFPSNKELPEQPLVQAQASALPNPEATLDLQEHTIQPAPKAPSATPKEAWNRMLSRLAKDIQNGGIYSLLIQGRYGGFENDTFSISMSQENEMYANLLAEESRSSVIAGILTEEMGYPVQFSAGIPRAKPTAKNQSDVEEEHVRILSQAFGREKIRVRRD